MSLQTDLEEVVSKAQGVLEGVKSQEPSLAEKLLQAVEAVLLDAGYQKPVQTPEPGTEPTTADVQ